jgi:hypothetical protein
MGLLERVRRARVKATLRVIIHEMDADRVRRQRTVEAINASKDGGLLVHVAIEQGA